LIRQVEDQKAEIDRIQRENEEEKAVLESGLDETLLELATLKEDQGGRSSALQARLDAMTLAQKRKLQEILGMSDDLLYSYPHGRFCYRIRLSRQFTDSLT
jgi:hypothetical protein